MESTISKFWHNNGATIIIILFVIFITMAMLATAEKNKIEEQKYLQGTYYLKKWAQPDPYPNFPGSIV